MTTPLTDQSVALMQRHFGEAVVGADDGIMGRRTKAAMAGVGAPFLPMHFERVTGAPLDPEGNPDYPAWLRGQRIACEGHYAPAVSGRFVPKGLIIHHTGAMSNRERIPADRMIKGRSGLSGPIVQFGVSRDMSVDVYTDGRAHHAGAGDGTVLDAVKADEVFDGGGADDTAGNSYFLGIEVDAKGRADEPHGPHWKKAAQVAAAICKLWKWDPAYRVIAHADWTRRKRDPIYPMSHFEDMIDEFLHDQPVGHSHQNFAVVDGKRYRLVLEE